MMDELKNDGRKRDRHAEIEEPRYRIVRFIVITEEKST